MSGVDPVSGTGAHRFRDRVKALMALESIAVAIALVTPLTPTRTGSTWSPAEIFTTDPSYLEKALASFAAVNLLLAVLGFVVWILTRLGRSD